VQKVLVYQFPCVQPAVSEKNEVPCNVRYMDPNRNVSLEFRPLSCARKSRLRRAQEAHPKRLAVAGAAIEADHVGSGMDRHGCLNILTLEHQPTWTPIECQNVQSLNAFLPIRLG
jgi:hypothetical protein